jgi:hypothetical protein
MYNVKNNRYNFNNFIILYYSDYEIIMHIMILLCNYYWSCFPLRGCLETVTTVTKPYIAQRICRVLRYERGEGGQNSQNPRYVIYERSLLRADFDRNFSDSYWAIIFSQKQRWKPDEILRWVWFLGFAKLI